MILRIILLLILCSLHTSIDAQKLIIDPIQTIKDYEVQDFSGFDFNIFLSLTNNTTDSLNLIWRRTIAEDCPENWTFGIYDKVFCYFHEISSNVIEDIGLDQEFYLFPEETFESFFINFNPDNTDGCCRLSFDFIDRTDPEVILQTAIVDISVNSQNCSFSSLAQEIEEAKLISIFPNPTIDVFTLSNNVLVKHIVIYNSIGQKLRSFEFYNGEYFNISDLSNDIYTVVLMNKDKQVLKSLMINKM